MSRHLPFLFAAYFLLDIAIEDMHNTRILCLRIRLHEIKKLFDQTLSEIPYMALPAALVEKVEIDMEKLRVGDVIKVGDLPLASDKDIDLKLPLDEVVLSVVYPNNADVAEEESTEESE